MFGKLWSDEEGLTTVEYALILGLIASGSVIIWTLLGRGVSSAPKPVPSAS